MQAKYLTILVLMFCSCASKTVQVYKNKTVENMSKITINRHQNNRNAEPAISVYDDSIYIGDLGFDKPLVWYRLPGQFELTQAPSFFWGQGKKHTLLKGELQRENYTFTIGHGSNKYKSYLECISVYEDIKCQFPISNLLNDKMREQNLLSPDSKHMTIEQIPEHDGDLEASCFIKFVQGGVVTGVTLGLLTTNGSNFFESILIGGGVVGGLSAFAGYLICVE